MTRKAWIPLFALLAILVAGELVYTRTQIASGSSGEELFDAWIFPFGTILFVVGCLALAKGRTPPVKLAAGVAVLVGLAMSVLGYVLVTRW